MNRISHTVPAFISRLTDLLKNALHRAVVAPRYDGFRPRWRNIGQPILPYHYLRPVPVVIAKK